MHLLQKSWPAICSEVCCYHWNYSKGWLIHTRVQEGFQKSQLLVVTDPRVEHQPFTSQSCLRVNLLTIALCNTLSSVPCEHIHSMHQQGSSLSGTIGSLLWLVGQQNWTKDLINFVAILKNTKSTFSICSSLRNPFFWLKIYSESPQL